MKSMLFCLVCLVTAVTASSQQPKPRNLVSQLTLEEKVNLVVGLGMNIPGLGSNAPVIGQVMDRVPGAAGSTFAIPRLGLPNTIVADGPAGLRIEPRRKDDPQTYFATAWPVATLLASTWDTALVQEVGKAMGNEVKEYGVDVLLGPGMNIHRNPLGGRNFEYYSEDPLLTGKMAAAMVNGIQSNGVGTSIKHFAVNNQETRRNSVNVIASERALREIYLRGFEIAVKQARPWTVMSSYNYLNGLYTSENSDLLNTILRKEWGFKGLVMTDWFGGKDAVAQMKAGNDLLMPGKPEQKKAIMDAVQTGNLAIAVLDQNVERILQYILETPSFKKYAYSNKPDLLSHASLARRAAAEGMILLQNETSTLPLGPSFKKVAAFGNYSYAFISGGTGSGDVNEAYTVSLFEGLEKGGYTLDGTLRKSYTAWLDDYNRAHPKGSMFQEFMKPTPPAPEYALDAASAETAARENDIAIITLGRNAGEGRDRQVENDFYLSSAEVDLLKNVANAFHSQKKKVVVILNTGGVVETASWRHLADAILLAWQPGLEAGNAVTDVLSGKVNPSGKLATTFPARYEDDVTAKNFPGREFPDQARPGPFGSKEIPGEVTYEEGIFVGYRYYQSYQVKPAWAFGHGLSYTSFSYSSPRLSAPVLDRSLTVSITVTNTGPVAGREVVQLYVHAPGGGLVKPASELKAFAKSRLLQPGESEELRFTLTPELLASFNSQNSCWVAAGGEYEIRIGTASDHILQKATFQFVKDRITQRCNRVLVPQTPVQELK